MNGLRQYFNIYLFSFILIYAYDKEVIKSLLTFFIGIGIHKSFMFLFPFVFMKKIIEKIDKKFLIFLLLFSFISNFLPTVEIIKRFLTCVPIYGSYADSDYFSEIPLINKVTKFVYIPFYISAVNLLEKLDDLRQKYMLKIGLIAFGIRIFCLKLTALNRLGDYFTLISIFPIYYLIIHYYEKKEKFKLLLILIIISCIFLIKVIILPRNEYLYKSIFYAYIN